MSDAWKRNTEQNSWCPGCGNFAILDDLAGTLAGMGIKSTELVVVSGIGQAGKTPHYLACNMFNGLHGRAVPLATGVKAANPGLTVMALGGDGDMYGEGGNHLLHAIRRNPDITAVVHNNMVYGLTKGQASPTSPVGMVTPVQVHGVAAAPLNPLALAVCQDIAFAGRALAGDRELTTSVVRQALETRGFSLVEILQPCVTFNRTNTWRWFKDNSFLPDGHDPADRNAALALAMDTERLALGVLYKAAARPVFEDSLAPYLESDRPLCQHKVDREKLRAHLKRVGE